MPPRAPARSVSAAASRLQPATTAAPSTWTLSHDEQLAAVSAFDRRESQRVQRRCSALAALALLVLLLSITAGLLAPRPLRVTLGAVTASARSSATDIATGKFAVAVNVKVSADNTASYTPAGLRDVTLSVSAASTNGAIARYAAPATDLVSSRSSTLYSLNAMVSTNSTGVGGSPIGVLACGQAYAALVYKAPTTGNGCVLNLVLSYTTTWFNTFLERGSLSTSVTVA